MAMSSSKLKQDFLKLLKEDEEFRYAVAGLIGLSEVFKELRDLRKAVHEQGESIKSMQETIKSMQEAIKSMQEAIKSMQEVLLRHGKAIESLQESVKDLSRTVAAIGRRYGVVTEEAFRESIKYLVEDLLKAYTVSRWRYFDSEGIVFGTPSVVEVDALIKDGEHILIEYKAHADRGDIAELHRIGILYEKVAKVKPKLLIVAATISRKALELAKELGVEVRIGEVW